MGLSLGGIFGSNPLASIGLAVITGGTSLAVQTALRGVMMAVGDQVLQNIGQRLGLPQSAIDMAQAAFHSAAGDPGGAVQNLREAADGAAQLIGGGPFEAGEVERLGNDIAQQQTQSLLNAAKNEENVEGGEGQTFLMKLALALGKLMDKKMNAMVDVSQKIGGLGEITGKNQSKLGELTGQMQALGQKFGLLSNALTNTLKSAGDGLSTVVRKG